MQWTRLLIEDYKREEHDYSIEYREVYVLEMDEEKEKK